MDPFWFRTTSNKPRLRDPTKVMAIIDRYYFYFDLSVTVERAPDGHYLLSIDGDGWPGAWLFPAAVLPDAYEPDFDQDGLIDFEPMLLEIAPYLAEPLIVQAIGTVKGVYPLNACQWRVEPLGANIDKVEFTSDCILPPASSAAAHVLLTA